MPITTSLRARRRRRARSPRRASARARRGPRSRTASGRGTRGAGSARSPRPRLSRASRRRFSSAVSGCAVAAGLDRLAQPDALLVVGDVLDLVRDRPAVGLAQPRQHLGERLARRRTGAVPGRDARLELRRQRRLEALGLERRVAERLGAERVEPGGEVAVRAVRLDERHRGGDAAEQLVVAARPARASRRRCGRSRSRRRRSSAARAAARARAARPTSSPSPLSNRARHSAGTDLGFSRYCSSSWPA